MISDANYILLQISHVTGINQVVTVEAFNTAIPLKSYVLSKTVKMQKEKMFYVLYFAVVAVSTLRSVQGDTCMTDKNKAVRLRSNTVTGVLEYSGHGQRSRYSGYYGSVCYWLIQSDGKCDSVINLQVETTTGRWLRIYDGQESYNEILWSSGRQENVTSSSVYVLIAFATRSQGYSLSTLRITYKSVKTEKIPAVVQLLHYPNNQIYEACDSNIPRILFATYGPNYIQSPGFGNVHNEYGNSLRCTWLIMSDCYAVIKITFTDLFTENDFDVVRIYDGLTVDSKLLGAFSGSEVPNSVLSTGHEVLVTFIANNENTYRGFKFKYEKALKHPFIQPDVKMVSKNSSASLTVAVMSYSPIRAVYWLRNRNLVYNDTDIVSNTDTDDYNTTNSTTLKQSTLYITSITENTYGTYKVLIQNEAGFSEKLIQLRKPYGCKVAFADYSVSMKTDRLTIKIPVTFSSSYSAAKWFKKNILINKRSHKYEMLVSHDSKLMRSMFQLDVFSPKVDDYTQYKLSITCEERTAEINIPVQVPKKYIPLIGKFNTNVEKNAMISVSFESSLVPHAIQWEKDSTVLAASDKYGLWSDNNTGITSIEIYSVNEADFGSYKLSITNAAGTGISYIDLNKPKVFPVIRTCKQFQTIDISCTIHDCEESFLPWIHSINGTEIRRIAGHVVDLRSTITITQCTGEDIGRYTCVTEQTLPNGTKISLTRDYALLRVNALPLIDSAVSIVKGYYYYRHMQITVNVTSNPPIRSLRWFKDEVELRNGISITEQPVDITIRGTLVTSRGYRLQLDGFSYGKYKVYVANDVGVSERSIQVNNPEESIYIITEETSFISNGDNISVSVTFFALPEYNFVYWTNKEETGTTLDSSPRHIIRTKAIIGRLGRYMTEMTVTDSTASDYTQYKVSVKNEVGRSECFVTLKNPDEGVPVFRDEVLTTLDGNVSMITVNFTSHPVIHSVMWFKDDTTLVSSQKYISSTQEQTLKIANADSVEITNGYQNQLQIADFNENDFGTYRVQLQNGQGYAEKLVTLSTDSDCEINNNT